jgi:peptide/nickel transport system ATP-binding protein
MTPGRLRAVRWTEAAIVFQGAMHALNPVWKVKHQIGEAIELHDPSARGPKAAGKKRDRVDELLHQVGLPTRRAEAYPHQLSGGQRQRVMIAMALACSPRLLIADEPTTALDVMVQAQVLALLEQLQTELGLAMVFITHDLSVLTSCCKRLAIMYAGRIVETGPSHQVFVEPEHPYTRALAAAFPTVGDLRFRKAPLGLPGDPPDPRDRPNGCPFTPRCPDAHAECGVAEPDLRDAGPGRAAACVLVGKPR